MMKTPEQIIQEQVNPSKPRGGLGGLLDYAKTRNNDTGLSRMQNFAAALDPLIMPEMRGGEAIRERGAQRVAAGNKNKTIEYLKANGFEDIANALATGSIDAGSAVNFAFQRQAADKEFGKQKELIDYKAGLEKPDNKALTQIAKLNQDLQAGRINENQYNIALSSFLNKNNMTIRTRPDGTFEFIKGAQPDAANLKKVEDDQEFKDFAFVGAGERILKAIDEGKFMPVTGVIADKLKDTPFGQVQRDVAEDLELLATQMQFEAISAMKAASRTGASGLGQLTDAERKAVGKLKTNFDNAQSPEAVKRAVKSSILLKAYFKNGLKDLNSNEERNATPQEMEAMVSGVNPFLGNSNLSIGNVPSFSSPSLSDKDLEEKYM